MVNESRHTDHQCEQVNSIYTYQPRKDNQYGTVSIQQDRAGLYEGQEARQHEFEGLGFRDNTVSNESRLGMQDTRRMGHDIEDSRTSERHQSEFHQVIRAT